MSMTVTSPAFDDGQPLPQKFTCQGDDISPQLKWTGVQDGAKSIALIMDDPDAPIGTWVHWVLYNIPADVTELAEGTPADEKLATGAVNGKNSWGRLGHGGPCPPPGGPHPYYFKFYALGTTLDLAPGATKDTLLGAMEGHILAEGQLMGTYKRK